MDWGEHLGQKLSSIRLRLASLVRMEAEGESASVLTGKGKVCGAPRVHS